MAETTAEVTEFIDASADAVWEALTDPESIKEYYLGATVESDWNVGHPITWQGSWNGKPYSDKGKILEFDSGRRLSYSHWSPMTGTSDAPENYHRIDIDLTSRNGGTEVRLRQSNLEGGVTDADRTSRTDYEKNWQQMLGGLRRVVERATSE
jgi:uncharacterized protein YndB with AHSA1/START domain